ncbi:MAG TPA: FAD-dependent oxidoreductase, partial [Chitinophagales bacterium]|nr:FAD-dependent oxidoreductase [Chitinophagales bacterium]
CPSIEDKINRFADKDRHQIFVEPEGWNTVEIYVNGFSTSLPEDVQYKALTSIPGFEKVKMFRPGYAIEYDYFPPTQLALSLETRLIKNLFFAGQINGTTGYEEAAAQGMMAGINAHRAIHDEAPVVLKRSEAYIGVLIDDLVNKGTEEPYRMFTSRAEFRILLRQDNADLRLTELSNQIGFAEQERMDRVQLKKQASEEIIQFIKEYSVEPAEVDTFLESRGTSALIHKMKLEKIVSRPQIGILDLIANVPSIKKHLDKYEIEFLEQAEIAIKYDGYIAKEYDQVKKMDKIENVILKPDFDYMSLPSLSMEARQKLSKMKPQTLGQASRISGVSPADISVLMVYLGR